MDTITPIGTFNQFLESKYPNVFVMAGLIALSWFSISKFDNLDMRVGAVEQDIKQLNNRVYVLEVKVDYLMEDVKELKRDVRQMKDDVAEIKAILLGPKKNP